MRFSSRIRRKKKVCDRKKYRLFLLTELSSWRWTMMMVEENPLMTNLRKFKFKQCLRSGVLTHASEFLLPFFLEELLSNIVLTMKSNTKWTTKNIRYLFNFKFDSIIIRLRKAKILAVV